MSLHVHREISCDVGGKGTFDCDTYDGAPWHRNATEVRDEAREHRGWVYRNGMDLCPKHAEVSEVLSDSEQVTR